MNGFARLSMVACFVVACAEQAPAVDESATGGEMNAADAAPTDRISIAMSAAPASISGEATIMDFDADGNLVELRAGSNGWLCLPDDSPAAPGDAPICVDTAWQQWFDAYMKQEAPVISGVGMSYMLMGGPAASNTDPLRKRPLRVRTGSRMVRT